MEQAKAHRLRHGRHSEPNRIYLITTTTHNRLPVFREFSAARALIHVLKNAQYLKQAETLAFVVMPDHLHWLMQLGVQSSLSKTVQSVKSYSARRLGINPLWQAGFHDHALRHEDDVINIARYIVMNPVRAGITNSIRNYPHWDAVWL
jgi:REP element-mobilizing transposase RayT